MLEKEVKAVKKSQMIYYIDQTSEKNHHMVFNAAMITMLYEVYQADEIHYIGIKSNQAATNSILKPQVRDVVVCKEIKYPISPGNKIAKTVVFLYKELIRLVNFVKILTQAKPNDIIVLSVTTVTTFFLFRVIKLLFRTTTFAVLHGDIDFLYNATNNYEKFNAFLHKRIFKYKQASFKFILINKISKERLIKDGLLKAEQIIEINHSFTLSEPNLFENNLKAFDKINIGHIGSMEVERKNSHLLYDLAHYFAKEIAKKEIEFATIGLITPNILPFKNDLVVEKTGNSKPHQPDYLDRTEYETYCAALHFTIFFYDQNQYVFRTSGAVIDTIAMKIPVIGFRHPFFEYIQNQVGPIGYFFDDLADVKKQLPVILANKTQLKMDYLDFKQNLEQANSLFSLPSIAADFKNQTSQT